MVNLLQKERQSLRKKPSPNPYVKRTTHTSKRYFFLMHVDWNIYNCLIIRFPGNGHLSLTEFEAHVGADFLFTVPLFNYFDGDKNQMLSVREFVDIPFNEMNTNGMHAF